MGMCSLMDSPHVEDEDGGRRIAHPASLSPSMASMDTCNKILSLMRTLLRGEGQAVFLRDSSSADESYRVIYSGTAIRWTGLDPGEFGLVSGNFPSLVPPVDANDGYSPSVLQSALSSHKTTVLSNVHADTKYRPVIDGNCATETPYLVVPLRGRTGCVIGCIISVRGHKGVVFNAEDVLAAEMISAFSSLSLYWCHGMVSLHDKLLQSLSNLEALEESIKRQQKEKTRGL